MKFKKKIFFCIKIFFFICISIKANFSIPEKPKKIYPINDFSRKLTYNQIFILNNKLIKINKKKTIEIVISIIDTINTEDVSMVANKWGQTWKIGNKKESNGIFILLVDKEKKISIQTGYGVEPYITDIICKKIINKIIPYIKNRDYYLAIEKIINIIDNNTKNYSNKNINKENKINYINYILLIIIIFIFYLLLKRKYKYYSDEEYLFPPNIGTYNNKNNEDDNFDGFGGGGEFGGGGASSNW